MSIIWCKKRAVFFDCPWKRKNKD